MSEARPPSEGRDLQDAGLHSRAIAKFSSPTWRLYGHVNSLTQAAEAFVQLLRPDPPAGLFGLQ
jgi:hypothetical protein